MTGHPTTVSARRTTPSAPRRASAATGGGTARGRRRRFEWTFFALAIPAIVVYIAFLLGPVLASFALSLTQWDGINSPVYVGLKNYARLASDENYRSALLHTLAFTAIILTGQIVFGLGLALLLNKAHRGTSLLRATFFTPVLLSTAVLALIWGFIYNPLVGVVPKAVDALGLDKSVFGDLLGSSTTAIWAVSGVVIWQYAGYIMVIFLAGLKGIPPEIYEAADLDGAHGWRRFWSITWPLLAPSTLVVVTLSIAGNLRLFDQVFLLTGGGPAGATETAGTLIYRTAFGNSNYGYSTTQSVVLALLTTLVVVGQRWLAGRRSK